MVRKKHSLLPAARFTQFLFLSILSPWFSGGFIGFLIGAIKPFWYNILTLYVSLNVPGKCHLHILFKSTEDTIGTRAATKNYVNYLPMIFTINQIIIYSMKVLKMLISISQSQMWCLQIAFFCPNNSPNKTTPHLLS